MDSVRRRKAKSTPYIRVGLQQERHQHLSETCSGEETEDSEYSEGSLRRCVERDNKSNRMKSRRRKTVKFTNSITRSAQEVSLRRHQMFLNFSKLQLEESFSLDSHRKLYGKFERTESILSALQQYIDCLNLELKASYRLCSEISGLVVKDNSTKTNEDALNLINNLCQLQLIDENNCVTNTILDALQVDKDIDHAAKEFNRRKKDLNVASRNFRILLNEYDFNMPQMELLQRQYQDILRNFQHSRYLFDKKLPNVISSRMKVLACCLGEMKCNLERISNERSDLSLLFKHLETSFNSPLADSVTNQGLNETLNTTVQINMQPSKDSALREHLPTNLI